jgi:hypothetical protein
MNRETVIKIILSIVFLICLKHMPYVYYRFARFAGLAGFICLAYFAFLKGRHAEGIVYCLLALLFQPIFKIALGREIWNGVDLVTAVGLMVSVFSSPSKRG